MKGFLLGALLASLCWGGVFYWQWQRWQLAAKPEESPAAASDDADDKRERRPRRRRRPAGPRPNVADEGAPEPEPMALTAADTRLTSKGDNLSGPDVLSLDMADPGEARELGQDEIDERFRARERDILGCIEAARPDTITYVPGRVTVHFRIQRTGQVRGVRVEAPAILQRGGLYECIRRVVLDLRFPASGGSQTVSYPYQLS